MVQLVKSQNGISIVATIVAVGILGIISMIFSSMMSMQYKQVRDINQKVETLELRNAIMTIFSNPDVCTCNFNPNQNTAAGSSLVFDSGNLTTTKIDVSSLSSQCDSSGAPQVPFLVSNSLIPGTQTGLKVSNIEISDFTTPAAGAYQGTLRAFFDDSSTTRGRAPIELKINMAVDVSNPTQAKITRCGTGSALSLNSGTGTNTGTGTTGTTSPVKGCVITTSSGAATENGPCPAGTVPTSCMAIAYATSGTYSQGSVTLDAGTLINRDPYGGYLGTTPWDGTSAYTCGNTTNIAISTMNGSPTGAVMYTCCPE